MELPGNIAQPHKGVRFGFLPEPSVFVPYPQHETVVENLENLTHFGKPELPIVVYATSATISAASVLSAFSFAWIFGLLP